METHTRTPIDILELSSKSENCLKKADYRYVEQVELLTDRELLRIKNLGAKCLKEIRVVIEEYREEPIKKKGKKTMAKKTMAKKQTILDQLFSEVRELVEWREQAAVKIKDNILDCLKLMDTSERFWESSKGEVEAMLQECVQILSGEIDP